MRSPHKSPRASPSRNVDSLFTACRDEYGRVSATTFVERFLASRLLADTQVGIHLIQITGPEKLLDLKKALRESASSENLRGDHSPDLTEKALSPYLRTVGVYEVLCGILAGEAPVCTILNSYGITLAELRQKHRQKQQSAAVPLESGCGSLPT